MYQTPGPPRTFRSWGTGDGVISIVVDLGAALRHSDRRARPVSCVDSACAFLSKCSLPDRPRRRAVAWAGGPGREPPSPESAGRGADGLDVCPRSLVCSTRGASAGVCLRCNSGGIPGPRRGSDECRPGTPDRRPQGTSRVISRASRRRPEARHQATARPLRFLSWPAPEIDPSRVLPRWDQCLDSRSRRATGRQRPRGACVFPRHRALPKRSHQRRPVSCPPPRSSTASRTMTSTLRELMKMLCRAQALGLANDLDLGRLRPEEPARFRLADIARCLADLARCLIRPRWPLTWSTSRHLGVASKISAVGWRA